MYLKSQVPQFNGCLCFKGQQASTEFNEDGKGRKVEETSYKHLLVWTLAMKDNNDKVFIGYGFVDGSQGIGKRFGMAKVFINRLEAFLHIYELKTESGLTGNRGLRKMALETIPNITNIVTIDDEIKDRFSKCASDIADNKLVLLIPHVIFGVRFENRSNGGSFLISGGKGDSGGGLRIRAINKFPETMVNKEGFI